MFRYANMYVELLRVPFKLNLKRSHLRGCIFGFSQVIFFKFRIESLPETHIFKSLYHSNLMG